MPTSEVVTAAERVWSTLRCSIRPVCIPVAEENSVSRGAHGDREMFRPRHCSSLRRRVHCLMYRRIDLLGPLGDCQIGVTKAYVRLWKDADADAALIVFRCGFPAALPM